MLPDCSATELPADGDTGSHLRSISEPELPAADNIVEAAAAGRMYVWMNGQPLSALPPPPPPLWLKFACLVVGG